MAVDMFLQLDGIKGESKDDKYKDEIDVLAWSWGMSQSASWHHGGGGGQGKVNVQDISLTKYIDKASSDLMKACATGKHVTVGTLIVRKAGGDQKDYLTIKFDKLIVTSVSTGGSGGEDRLTENITLNFAKVDVKYGLQDDSGDALNAGNFVYDIEANKAG